MPLTTVRRLMPEDLFSSVMASGLVRGGGGVSLLFLFNQLDVLGRENGDEFGVSGCVGVVADVASVACAGAAIEVPVSVHAAVRAVCVVAILWAVALGAELHGVLEGNS